MVIPPHLTDGQTSHWLIQTWIQTDWLQHFRSFLFPLLSQKGAIPTPRAHKEERRRLPTPGGESKPKIAPINKGDRRFEPQFPNNKQVRANFPTHPFLGHDSRINTIPPSPNKSFL